MERFVFLFFIVGEPGIQHRSPSVENIAACWKMVDTIINRLAPDSAGFVGHCVTKRVADQLRSTRSELTVVSWEEE